jgi:hypothetical protein
MALLQTKWISDDAVDGSKIKLKNNEFLRARDSGDMSDVDIVKLDEADNIIFANTVRVGSDRLLQFSERGAAFGLAPLNASSKIDATYLPSYVDDVLEVADFAALPGTGETGKLYVTLDTNLVYRWSGSVYIEVSPTPVLTSADIDHTQATPANWTVADESSVGAHLDEVGSRLASLEAAPAGYTPGYEVITLDATDITNEYVTLAQSPIANSVSVSPKGGLEQELGVDFSVTGAQLDFLGDLLANAAEGDKLIIKYVY